MIENNDDNNQELKEELNKKMKNIEEKFIKLINTKESNLNNEITNINLRIKDTLEKTDIIVKEYSSQKIDHQKLVELDIFKNKVDALLITHELRINNNIQDLAKFQTKYDEAILNNLRLRGFIGPSCKFRTIGEYLNHNIYEMSRLISEKEQIKKDTKDFKNKLDSMMKQMIVLNDSSVERCTEYFDNKYKEIQNFMNVKIFEFAEKNQEIRILFSEFENSVTKKLNGFNDEINKILNIKDELIYLIEEKIDEVKKNIHEVHKKVVLNIQDIGILKRKVNDLNELNSYYKKAYSNKKINFFKRKNNMKSFHENFNSNLLDTFNSNILDNFNSNMIDIIKNRENKNDLKKNNYFSSKTVNKQNDFIALNFEKKNENFTNNNLYTINNKKYEIKKIPQLTKKEKDTATMSIKKVELNRKDKISRSEYTSKKKNFISQNKSNDNYKIIKKENKAKIDSFDNLSIKSNIITKYSEPFILDQKILSDEVIKTRKEKKIFKKEMIKKNLQKNLFNLRIISGNNALDLYNYSTSVPRISSLPKKENKIDNNIEEVKNKEIKLKTLTNINYDKLKLDTNINNTNINYKLVNLELEENASINPETNNGAYVIAHKQNENSNKTKLNIIPTSYVNVYNIVNKSTRLMNMTFAKEGIKNKNSE